MVQGALRAVVELANHASMPVEHYTFLGEAVGAAVLSGVRVREPGGAIKLRRTILQADTDEPRGVSDRFPLIVQETFHFVEQ